LAREGFAVNKILGLFAASVLSLAAWAPARAGTIVEDFEFYSANNTELVSGSFSYNSSLSGVLSFADLTSFTLSAFGQSYNLSYVDSLTSPSDYVYFGYDTATQLFVPAAVTGSQGPFSGILAATDTSTGFFFDPLVGSADPANTGADGFFTIYPGYANVFAAGYLVPEPASAALLVIGLTAVGVAARRRHRGS
jgi:hypothetical protein